MPKLNTVYDIGTAFEAIEDELMASMIRNMKRHKVEEIGDAKQWSMWQAEMLHSLEKYRHDNQKKFGKQFQAINSKITGLIQAAKIEGGMAQETKILDAIRKGFPAKQAVRGGTAEFIKVNDRKLNALIEATQNDMQSAEAAVLRMANDQYRKIIFNAQMYANSGAGTYEKAVDIATKDFLSAGLNCIQYANGARHTIADYADMAIRTASKRAYLQGEGQKRQEWGICTVIMNKRGSPCPKCLPFVGKVMIDDVWSGGPKSGKSPVTGIRYPLMSSAVAAGLYHPRCQDHHSTYFEGVSEPPDEKYTREELNDLADQARQEAKQQYAARQEKRFGRLAEYSLDPENQKRYELKRKEWKNVAEQGIKEQIEQLEKQFSDMTEGYSYDDFIRDFGSIENGFEGADEQEIQKAQEIADKIKALKGNIKPEKITRTKEDAIQALKTIGIDFKDNSTGGISGETVNKFADFITNFEHTHAGYFVENKVQLNSISISDKLRVNGRGAAGVYNFENQSIILKKECIETKPKSLLVTYSKSDDFELHTLAHEYGHYIADTIEKNLSVTDYDVVQNSLLRFFKDDPFKAKPGNLVDALSSYGSTSGREAFAEAFAEAYTCKEPGEFSKIFKEELEKVIGGTERKAGVKSVANTVSDDIIEISKDSTIYEGIPKNWKMLKSKEIALQSVNPKYATGDIAYRANCPNCVSAYEMRKRGYDVTAKPSGKNHYLNRNPETAWIDPDVRKATGSGKNDILKSFKEWPENSRAEIAVVWKGNNKGHVIVAEKIKGDVLFYDVQSGNALPEDFWERIEEERTLYWRIDNIEPSDRGITACERGDIYEV